MEELLAIIVGIVCILIIILPKLRRAKPTIEYDLSKIECFDFGFYISSR